MNQPREPRQSEGAVFDRRIPMPWLISFALGIVVQSVTVWLQVQSLTQVTRDLVTEVKELRSDAQKGGLEVVKHDFRLVNLENRVTALEAKK